MSNCDYSLDMSDLVNKLNRVIERGERIALGSDTALMREAAGEIEKLRPLAQAVRRKINEAA